MKHPLDAARLRLQRIDPESPEAVRLRIARQIATECSDEDLATLLQERMRLRDEAERDLARSEVQLLVVARARGFQNRG